MIKAILLDAGGVLYLNNDGMGHVNMPLLEFIKMNQERYIFGIISTTDYNLNDILEKYGIDALFKIVLTSGETGLEKNEFHIYKKALLSINLEPEEVIFIDNEEQYLEAAAFLGIRTILYNGDFDLCRREIEQIILQ